MVFTTQLDAPKIPGFSTFDDYEAAFALYASLQCAGTPTNMTGLKLAAHQATCKVFTPLIDAVDADVARKFRTPTK